MCVVLPTDVTISKWLFLRDVDKPRRLIVKEVLQKLRRVRSLGLAPHQNYQLSDKIF